MNRKRQAGTGIRKNRRNRKLGHYKRSIVMVCAVLICLTGVLTVGSVRLQAKNARYKAQEAELEEQIQAEKERAEEVEEFEKYVKTDEYIKEMAEDKLNLVDPNEIIFKPSS